MCGIFSASVNKKSSQNIQVAVEAISHRGPDGFGVFETIKGDCIQAHTRLSILDTSSNGHQPMFSKDNLFSVVFNGEIYNFQELKKYLEINYPQLQWSSNSDTEVLIEGFAREGEKFLNKLNGIFSICIYDFVNSELTVLRDPLAVKPLFYIETNTGFYFSSELSSLVTLHQDSLSLRKQSFYEQLAFMFIPEPHTYFNEIKKLTPGVMHKFSHGKLIETKPLFSDLLYSKPSKSNYDELCQEFDLLLNKAIKRQLVSDVPVSVMLSGGLDSSCIAQLAINNGAILQSAYTIATEEKDNQLDMQESDIKYAKLMADRLGIELVEMTAKDDFVNLLPEMIRYFEDGISDPAAINMYLISERARADGVKVLLTGQGADEYLAGYRRHQMGIAISKIPQFSAGFFKALDSILPATIKGKFNSKYRRVKRALSVLSKSKSEKVFSLYSWADAQYLYNIFNNSEQLKSYSDFLNDFMSKSTCNTIGGTLLELDKAYDLTSLNLVYSDRMSMANGVEARVPLLDFELVSFMNRLPYETKLNKNVTKSIFKKVMEKHLPNEVIYREKSGFGLPLRAWLLKRIELVEAYLSSDSIEKFGLFDSKKISEILLEQQTGKKDRSNLIFSLLCIHLLFSSDLYQRYNFK
ncbi:asparagine synthase (glutamine-hydrolyzing) [Pseudoalteromonas sp. S16_S37]|uniref:asparagine synthase (glutamine-hydrolyzing) n=1 Tax=Pseudoalteromonas sp. S16_S37 TaxID=2720228 RepID=UPI001681707A|nr:asparagine synthase (glutamine-hydrolyzing) [Pseudoalteromonas sp. S16_S37]MBD1580937.1 asparagine synthase (glutamine-hydrolyzing) [Pseudoalteromonas sp. S16_S37]